MYRVCATGMLLRSLGSALGLIATVMPCGCSEGRKVAQSFAESARDASGRQEGAPGLAASAAVAHYLLEYASVQAELEISEGQRQLLESARPSRGQPFDEGEAVGLLEEILSDGQIARLNQISIQHEFVNVLGGEWLVDRLGLSELQQSEWTELQRQHRMADAEARSRSHTVDEHRRQREVLKVQLIADMLGVLDEGQRAALRRLEGSRFELQD